MDGRSIDRIKNANFSHAVRGYDRQEVDDFLRDLGDWLQGGGDEEAGSEAVRARLERVGEQTAQILAEAHDAAEAIREDAAAELRQALVDANVTSEKLRSQADEYAVGIRQEADAYALKTRKDADDYAAQARDEADAAAAELRDGADREATRIVEEANRRRRDVEALISDLEQRRDAVLGELERLASGIAGTATEHRGPGAPQPEPTGVQQPTEEAEATGSAAAGDATADEAETREQAAVQRGE